MVLFANLALLGWPFAVLLMFALFPSRQAFAGAVIGAWLFLPPYGLSIAGLPDYTKNTAATVGLILATLIFCPDRLLKFRPRWFDLPMLLFCITGFVTSVQNGLGVYDGLSNVLSQVVVWGLPYWFGRIYLGDLDSLRHMTTAMAGGGLLYVPLCLFEIRMMTSVMMRIYGIGKWASGTGLRMGGYRPNVFFNTGLECGLWMTAASMAGWWLWRCGALARIGQLPFGSILLPLLLITTILCRSTGAILLLVIGMLVLWLSVRFRTRVILLGLLLLGPTYIALRTSGSWSGQQAVSWATSLVGEERAGSLGYRLKCENLLIIRALQRPALGWGGWSRSAAYFENGKYVDTDGLWIILLGQRGLIGVSLFALAIILPGIIFVWRFPPSLWGNPRVAAASLSAVLLGLYMIDCLLNGFVNVIYLTLAGALMGVEPKQLRLQAPTTRVAGSDMSTLLARADHNYNLGRTLKAEGREQEALKIWREVLALLGQLSAAYPHAVDLRRRWCDVANDLAWLLVNAHDPAIQDPAESIALATRATETDPECATYWNTLGVAYYREGNLLGALNALDRAVALNHGGTAFDHVVLAMVHARLGHLEEARECFALATASIERSWPGHQELLRLRTEAKATFAVVGAAGPSIEVS